jgi:hypothetical protein
LLSPILVRPVREQLEHDRVIRLLQAKYKRKFDVAINPGNEETTPVSIGTSNWYPDLVLHSTERARKLMGTVEVETAESVNNLEAMSQWVTFSRLRAPFHLYVPASAIDTTRRLCQSLLVAVAELWAYHALGDQLRFTLVQRAAPASEGKARQAAPSTPRPAAPPATPRTPASRPRESRTATARSAKRAAPAAGTRRKAVVAKKGTTSRRAATKKASRSSRAQKRK